RRVSRAGTTLYPDLETPSCPAACTPVASRLPPGRGRAIAFSDDCISHLHALPVGGDVDAVVAFAFERGLELRLPRRLAVDEVDVPQAVAVQPAQERQQAGLVGVGRVAVHHGHLGPQRVGLAEDADLRLPLDDALAERVVGAVADDHDGVARVVDVV